MNASSATAPRIAASSSDVARRLAQVRHDDDALDRGQPGGDRCDLVLDRDRLAVVPVAVDGDEQLGLDLAEAIEHTLDAEVRRARRPDRAAADRRQHGGERLGHVGQVGRDPVAGIDAGRGQRRGKARHQREELAVGHLPLDLVLAAEHQRLAPGLRCAPGQQVLGEVEPRVREPLRARHPVAVHQRARSALADDPGVVPHRAPERLLVVDRPPPQRRVIGHRTAGRRGHPRGERGQVGGGDPFRGRLPEQGGLGHGAMVPGLGGGPRRGRRDQRAPPGSVSGAETASGSGVERPVARSIQTILAAPSA